jgi:hypothetical protein
MDTLGRALLLIGASIMVAGVFVLLADRIGLHDLPGTWTWKRGGVTVIVPIGLMIVVSIALSVVLSLVFRR